MKNKILLAFSITLLFIGVGIQPVLAEKVSTSISDNPPPNKPIIYGPIQGKVGVDYNFTFVYNDFEQRDFYYYIEWGDGTFEEWIGPYPAGLEVTVNHTWYEKGNYFIRCKAKDLWGYETDWGEYMFWIDRSRTLYDTVIHLFLEQFLILEVFLQIINLLR